MDSNENVKLNAVKTLLNFWDLTLLIRDEGFNIGTRSAMRQARIDTLRACVRQRAEAASVENGGERGVIRMDRVNQGASIPQSGLLCGN